MALPGTGIQAAIFDMDGVITRTAHLHAAAWKDTFDDFLRRRAPDGQSWRPFDAHADYLAYVDGKPRRDGVRSFLGARAIDLPEEEVDALAKAKDRQFERQLREQGVQTFASTIALVRELRRQGVKTGVVTSSRHGREILHAADIASLFDVALDGIYLDELALKGKPDPAMYLHAARELDVAAARAMVVEDAVAGVEAGRRGAFGLVVGVDRGGNAAALRQGGADIVVQDLAELGIAQLQAAFLAHREEAGWCIEEKGFDRVRERQMESLFCIGNGYMGIRGALDSPLPASQADLFIAGIYSCKHADLPYSEIEFLAPERGAALYAELVPLPFPFCLAIAVEGEPVDFAGAYGRELRRVLDMRRGVLHLEAAFETPGGRRTVVRSRRCASLLDPHLLLQEALVTPENHWGKVTLGTCLVAADLAVSHPHLQCLEHAVEDDLELVRYLTQASDFEICIVSRVRQEFRMLRRLVSVFTSRDHAEPRAAALAHAQTLDWNRFEAHFAGSAKKWTEFWSRADIRVPGHPSVEQALRFGSYHLRLPAGADDCVSIGARTLSGRAYEGHVFWDTEIFMLPFYLHVEPRWARNLLLYRHRTLDGARRRARKLGYRGACFAWESTVTGDDVTPTKILLKSTGKEIPIFTGSQQIHVTADIAYAVWRYWEATRDEDFLTGPGADLLFETARFWMSRVTLVGPRWHIQGVVGPDEYHHDVNDNAYTNWMARFNLERAAWLAQHRGVNAAEAQEWRELARTLYVPLPDHEGVIEQFAGFFALEDYPLAAEARLKAPISRLFDWDKMNRLKLLKQADVLMLPLLFPEAFTDEVVAANYRYYEPLTDHGSSLSPAVHAAIAARIGLQDDAERYWQQSLWLDLSNAMDNSMLGVHAAAMGGTWQALVFGFLGVRFDEEGPRLDACAAARLPDEWHRLGMKLAYRGRLHAVKVARTPARKEKQ
ncbi:HAD-IA family hydrolase [Noviherbaspirillum sedimenti]|uniref:HAD family hydrolase n=1 Tax=Noviherbaspirillum sedimenti TaxID=2320865 RepID=A0A3A3G041_9BURK|nr:HAD-IA family hydrolase [Noviherbaspirillum sedimenti]RJG01005.1 HAD family hydrolase [Noviherbaspirillum sedimenti]